MDFQEVTNYNILVKLGMLLQHLVFVMGFGSEIIKGVAFAASSSHKDICGL